MRVQVAIPEKNVTKPVLDAALEATTRVNQELLREGAPTSRDLIAAGARWEPEPPGQEHFDHVGLIQQRGHGDCDDWAPLHAATLRETGEDPGARAEVKRSGPKRWHAIVRRSNGTIDDPSLGAGMPGPGQRVSGWASAEGCAGVVGAAVPLMFAPQAVVGGTFEATPHLALRPHTDKWGQPESWQARADLPWHYRPGKGPTDIAMVSLHQTPVSDQALVGALTGAITLGELGGAATPFDLDRLAAVRDMCEGCPWEEVAARYGEHHADYAGEVVGSFFGKIFRGVKKLGKGVLRGALKVATPALNFIPGVGPIASMALKAASPMLKSALSRGHHVRPAHRAAVVHHTAPRVLRPVRRIVRPMHHPVHHAAASPGLAYPRPAGPAMPPMQQFWCFTGK